MKKQLILALVTFMWVQTNLHAQKEIIKNYSGIESLDIEGGSLEVSYTGNANQTDIDITAFLGSEEDREKDLVFVTVGNVLKIAHQPHKKSNNYNGPKRYLKITGPENMALKIKNSSGQILVDQVSAEKTLLSVSSGQVKASQIGGDLILKASSGSIQAQEISGSVTCSITSGISSIEEVGGNLDFSSTSGRLNASNILGRVNAQLTSGSISLDKIGELGEITVSSGNVKAKGVGLGRETVLKGSSGSFSIQTPSDLTAFNYNLQASSGSVSVGNNLSRGKKLLIQNGTSGTVRGHISSGRIRIEN